MRRPGILTLLLSLLVLALVMPGPASALRLVHVAGGFDSPVHATVSSRGDSLYVVEQEGQIWRLGAGGRSLFLDIRGLVAYGGERGLFSIAFPRNYGQSRYLYVNYTDNGGDVRVARFRANESFSRARQGHAEDDPRRRALRAVEPQRRPAGVRPQRQALRQRRRRRGKLRPRRERAGPLEPQGQAPQHRYRQAGGGLADRRLRAPQSLAVLVRPVHGTALRRRRGPGQLGGSKHAGGP